MENVGDILKAAREEEGYTLKEIGLQTNMGTKYLTAIEENRFEIFPSETHIIGFLRNYSSFLEIDPAPLIEIYKRQILQETPTPLEELTAPRRAQINPVFFVTIFVVALVIGLTILLVNKSGDSDGTSSSSSSSSSSNDHINNLKEYTKNFAIGEIVPIRNKNGSHQLRFAAISNNVVIIKTLTKQIPISLKQNATADLDGDGTPEVRVTINNITGTTINATISPAKAASSSSSSNSSSESTSSSSSQSQDKTTLKGKTILRSQDKVEINLTVVGKGLATLTVVKDNQIRENHPLQKGKKVSILAKNTLLIRVINPGNISLNLNNVDLEIATQNAAAGFLFKWRRNPSDGKYHLEYERIR